MAPRRMEVAVSSSAAPLKIGPNRERADQLFEKLCMEKADWSMVEREYNNRDLTNADVRHILWRAQLITGGGLPEIAEFFGIPRSLRVKFAQDARNKYNFNPDIH